mgnify:CR=1 FL=1
MEKIDIHYVGTKHKQSLDNLLKDKRFLRENKELVVKFLADASIGKTAKRKAGIKSCGISTQDKYLHNLKPLLRFSPKKPLSKLTAKDIESFVHALEKDELKGSKDIPYSSKTKSDIKKTVIILLRWLLGEGNKKLYEMTYWIDTRHERKDVLALEEHDIKKLLDLDKTMKEKVLIACLFDGGFRIEEFLNVRNSDVRKVEAPAPYYKIMIRTQFSKTKGRDVSMFWSDSYELIRSWITAKQTSKGLEEPFFNVSYRHCQTLLKELGDKIGIRLHAHLFRHSSATHYANKGLNEFQLNKRFGWGTGSDMGRRYVDSSKLDEKPQIKEYEESKLGDLTNQLRKQEEENRIRKEEIDTLRVEREDTAKKLERVMKQMKEFEEAQKIYMQATQTG